MAIKGFTKIDNSILFDSSLSLEAKSLYAMIQHLSTIPNFCIRRDYVKKLSGYGETAFRRVWKEIKVKGLLIETMLRKKGRYVYAYTLRTNENTTKTTAPAVENKPKHIDSDKNIPLDGQVNIDDVLEVEKEVPLVNENVAVITEATGFTNSEAIELLKEANNDVSKVIESYSYASKQKNVKSAFKYTKWVITNKIKVQNINTVRHEKKSLFNNFEQRTYDFDKLEKALLYGEQYELPA